MRSHSIGSALRTATLAAAGLLMIDRAWAGTEWDADWTVLAVGPGGAWGTATHASRSTAIAEAITSCEQAASDGAGRCGGNLVTVRAAWSLAYGCGDTTFLVTASSLAEARLEAVNYEIELRESEQMSLEPCRLLVAIGPAGRPVKATQSHDAVPVRGAAAQSR